MKKLLFLLLLITGSSYAQVNSSDYYLKTIITGVIEIDGHETKDIFILESCLRGIKIYNRDTKQEYQFRECKKDKCKTIHLEPKNIGYNGLIRLTPNNTYFKAD